MASVEYRQRNGVRFRDNPDWRCPRAGYFQNGTEVGQVDPATGKLACFAFGPNGSAGSGIASGYGLYGIYFNSPYNNIYTTGRISYAGGDINNSLNFDEQLPQPSDQGWDAASEHRDFAGEDLHGLPKRCV